MSAEIAYPIIVTATMTNGKQTAPRPTLKNSPIIIGGIGGSGTRVVAEILIRSGVFLGQDLNRENDNLLFAYFFKHPKRFANSFRQLHPMHEKLFAMHEKLFFGGCLTARDMPAFLRAGLDSARGRYSWRWVWERWRNIAAAKRDVSRNLWGWKVPMTIFHLHGIKACYPNAKFVLVQRNGLDMAYSDNKQQSRDWASCFDLNGADMTPQNRFEFWYRANRETIEMGRSLFSDSLLVLRIEELCSETKIMIRRLVEFAGLDSDDVPSEVWAMPQLPKSHGRYRRFDTTWIDSQVRHKLVEVGYENLLEG